MKTEKKILSHNLFPVVGVGASAGGLAAFRKFIKAIPERSGLAYVLVQHLDPNHESQLADILQRVAQIPVLEILDNIVVQPDHVYIIPSNKMLVANDGVLELSPRTTKKGEINMPIDLFFTSLAEIHRGHAIGVVLSGTGTDGTNGLKAIKANGGITVVQDKASAEHPGMPNSAVQAGVADFVLPPDEIPQKLIEITRVVKEKGGTDADVPEPVRDVFNQMLAVLRTRRGTDFTHYKQTTIRRRILRRMVINKNDEPADYLAYLRENKPEQDALYQDLLIAVTSFFRDQVVFNTLCESVFPQITTKPAAQSVRVWVAGCCTGEEAYSIAMCFTEFLGNNQGRIQIFATDLSEPAIAKARVGIYTKADVADVSPKRLQKFFTEVKDGYQINKQVRSMCVFTTHNFLKDPPFSKMDFISCRNVLIYMESYLQRKALTTFHYALNPAGSLLLGKSETISSVPDLFVAVGKGVKLFTRQDVPGRFGQIAGGRSVGTLRPSDDGPGNESKRSDFQKMADDLILSRYSPAGVVVNESMDIVHFRGNTTNYLEQSSGKPTHNVLLMAKYGLAFELRNLVHKAKKEKISVTKGNISVQVDGSLRTISIEAVPLPNSAEPHYLILFHPADASGTEPANIPKKRAATKSKKDDRDQRIQQLELELAQLRDDMSGITEDQEAVNEELQSANEELLSANEELQSLNEELETSKEELQSTNEELTVVNQEMVSLNEQIIVARDYAEAIVANIREPLVVLDKDLRIKLANDTFYKTFRVDERETEGILIYELGNKQWNIPGLRILLEQILPDQSTFADFELTHTFSVIGERTMLLNGREILNESSAEKLILLSIEDITERKQYERKERELLSRFQNLVLQASVGIAFFQGEGLIADVTNSFFLQMVGKQEAEFLGKSLSESMPETKELFEPIMQAVLKTGVPYYGNEFEFIINRFGKSETAYFNFTFQPVQEINGRITGIVCVGNEVTDLVIARKRMEVQTVLFEDMLMTSPGFVSTLRGPDHVYELVNEQYQSLFGSRKIQGKPVMVALPELEGQGLDLLLDKVYTTGEPYVGIEVPITLARDEHLAPEERFFNFSYQPMYDENKTIFSILVFGYEVTDQVLAQKKYIESQQLREKELEEKVQQRTLELSEANELLEGKNKELGQMNKELESFTYVSSHDLQEPLRKIQILASRILEKESQSLTDSGKDSFRRIRKSAQRMQNLIQDLLAFSRLGTAERDFETADLRLIVGDVVEELGEIIADKQATVDATELGPANIVIFQFRQLLHNLLTNALKFSNPGVPPCVVISSRTVRGSTVADKKLSPEKSYSHITVTDNGIGFDPQYSEKIFDVFQRLHSKEQYNGTGIGLSIVKRIVENHNGIITATGELNKGARFDIYIPAA